MKQASAGQRCWPAVTRACALQACVGKAGSSARWTAAGLVLAMLLLACAPAAARGAAPNATQAAASKDYRAEAAQDGNDTLPFLHPRLVVFGDSISSTGRTSAVVQKALGLGPLVRRKAHSGAHRRYHAMPGHVLPCLLGHHHHRNQSAAR